MNIGETVQNIGFGTLGVLLLLAALVAMVSARLKLPYSVGLLVSGLAVGMWAPGSTPSLTTDLILFVFLPPLIFEAAIQIPWPPLRREMPLVLALVTVGVVLAAAVVAAGMHWWMGWSWIGAALFGALIAATDPVSVIAAFKQMKVQPRLHLLVESESLLNDGVAAVLFTILVGLAGGGEASVTGIGWQLARTVLGGIAAGAVVAVPLILLAGRTTDRLVEVTLSVVIAYGSFLLAEHFHASGVLATLTAGLIMGNWGFLGSISDDGRQGVLNHWQFVAFLINSLIFLLIGGREASMPILTVLAAAGAAVVLAVLGRAAAVYPVTLAFARGRLAVSWAYKHVLFWGGLRGALALALALALPGSVPERGEIVVVAFAVVAFSILVQGLSMPWLIKALKLRQEE